MKHTLELLAAVPPADAGERFPISWSEGYRETLRQTSAGEIAPPLPTSQPLARLLLMCAAGAFIEAEREMIALLRQYMVACERDNEIFTSFINALFTVQRLDLVAAMLSDRYGYAVNFEFAVERGGLGLHFVKWDILASDEHRFTLDATAYETDETRIAILLFQWIFPLCAYYAAQPNQEPGSVIINLGDIGAVPGLAFCDNRPDRFLIPDNVFVPTKGYELARKTYEAATLRWCDRKPVVFWRGTTTGIQRSPGDWLSLDRIKLCDLARRADPADLFDAGISEIVQFDDPAIVDEIRRSGLVRGFVPWQEWHQYKYHIDIDGNTNSWSAFFYRLLTGSPVLKVESPRGMVQWFYDRLVPWGNYVPVAPDLSDLVEKVRWIRRNDAVAESIGRRGKQLADAMSYEIEAARAVPVISAAIRCAGGREERVGAYGRPFAAESCGAPVEEDPIASRIL